MAGLASRRFHQGISGNLFGDGSSLVIVSKLASDLCFLRSRGGSWADWRELSFFE